MARPVSSELALILKKYAHRAGTLDVYERRTMHGPEDSAFYAFAEVLEIDPKYLVALQRLATVEMKRHLGRDFGFPGDINGYSGMGSIMGENPIDIPVPHGNVVSDVAAKGYSRAEEEYCYEVAADIFRTYEFRGWSANRDSQIGFSMFSKDTDDRRAVVKRGLETLRISNPLMQELLACEYVSDAHLKVLTDPRFQDMCVFLMLAIERRQPWKLGKKVTESTLSDSHVHDVPRLSKLAKALGLDKFFGPARRRAPQAADFTYSGPLACLTAGYADPAYDLYKMTLKHKDPGSIRAKIQFRLNEWYDDYVNERPDTMGGKLKRDGKPFKVFLFAGDVVACEKQVPQTVTNALLRRHDELLPPYAWGRLTTNVPCLIFTGKKLTPSIVGDPTVGKYSEFSENKRGTQSGEFAVVTKNQVGVSSTFRQIFNKAWPNKDWLPSALEHNDRVMHLSKTDDNLIITIDPDSLGVLAGEHFDGIMPIELDLETNESGHACGTFLAMLYHITYTTEGAPLVHVQKELGTYISNCMPGEGGLAPGVSKSRTDELRWNKSSNRVSSRNAGFGFILRAIFYRQWNKNTEALHLTWMNWLREEFSREWYDAWPIAQEDINELRTLIDTMLEKVEDNSNFYDVKAQVESALAPWIQENPDYLYKGWVPLAADDMSQEVLEEAFMYVSPEEFREWTDNALPTGVKHSEPEPWAELHHVGDLRAALEFGLVLCTEAELGIRNRNTKRYISKLAPSAWYARAGLKCSKFIDRAFDVLKVNTKDSTRPTSRD